MCCWVPDLIDGGILVATGSKRSGGRPLLWGPPTPAGAPGPPRLPRRPGLLWAPLAAGSGVVPRVWGPGRAGPRASGAAAGRARGRGRVRRRSVVEAGARGRVGAGPPAAVKAETSRRGRGVGAGGRADGPGLHPARRAGWASLEWTGRRAGGREGGRGAEARG